MAPKPVPSASNAPNAPGTGSPNAPGAAGIHPLATSTPVGLPYGQAGALAQAQKQMPIAPQGPPGAPSMGPAPGAPPGPPGGGSGAPAGLPPGAMDAATGWTPPDHNFGGMSQNPGEPIQNGISSGPGAGPEALQPLRPPDPLSNGLALLNRLGPQVDGDTAKLRDTIQAMIGNRSVQ